LKKLADLYEKSHAMLDSLANASTGGGPPSGYLVGGAMLINTLGSSLFQSKTAAAIVDAPLNKLAASVLLARLGRYAHHYRLELRNGKELSRGSTARMDRSASRQFDKALRAGKAGPMTEIRIGSTLVFLEMWNLHNKLTAENKQSREYAEIVASLLALTATGVELGASAVVLAQESGSVAVRQGAKAFGSALRLGAGVLAGSAGLVGTWFDVGTAYDNFRVGKRSVSGLYILRAALQLGASSLSIAMGLGSAGAYFNYLLRRYKTDSILRAAVNAGTRTSAALAASMIPMLRMFFGINIILVALILAELYLLPDALEDYLDHCSFRKNRRNAVAASEELEIEQMQQAVEDKS
ncbi:hypothetical protein, partial [Achromobacter spanius]|uniref:hypothetical protein n=1 Tax=Achromobacter spanius TaxID=217203 RepID=UPI00320B57BC